MAMNVFFAVSWFAFFIIFQVHSVSMDSQNENNVALNGLDAKQPIDDSHMAIMRRLLSSDSGEDDDDDSDDDSGDSVEGGTSATASSTTTSTTETPFLNCCPCLSREELLETCQENECQVTTSSSRESILTAASVQCGADSYSFGPENQCSSFIDGELTISSTLSVEQRLCCALETFVLLVTLWDDDQCVNTNTTNGTISAPTGCPCIPDIATAQQLQAGCAGDDTSCQYSSDLSVLLCQPGFAFQAARGVNGHYICSTEIDGNITFREQNITATEYAQCGELLDSYFADTTFCQ